MTKTLPSFGVLLGLVAFAILSVPNSSAAAAPVDCDREAPGALAPSWSRDGSMIAYSSKVDGKWQIFTARADGGRPRRLTESETDDLYAQFSPDGTKIAFMANGTSGDTAVVRVVDIEGGQSVDLTPKPGYSGDPHWSPDGKEIVYHAKHANRQNIYVMRADGRQARQLTEGEWTDWNPMWSPDGSKIAFATDREGPSEIFVMDADGANVRNVSNDPIGNYFPDWSPDGSLILFSGRQDPKDSSQMEIFQVEADGAGRRQLTRNSVYDSAPHYSPDGSSILFASCRTGNYEIHVMDNDGSNVRRLTYSRGD